MNLSQQFRRQISGNHLNLFDAGITFDGVGPMRNNPHVPANVSQRWDDAIQCWATWKALPIVENKLDAEERAVGWNKNILARNCEGDVVSACPILGVGPERRRFPCSRALVNDSCQIGLGSFCLRRPVVSPTWFAPAVKISVFLSKVADESALLAV